MAKILVVDDERINLRLVRMTLETSGHEVVATQKPLEVGHLTDTQHFDAIIIDILMPKMTGWDLLEKLRTQPKTQHTPIVMLSGFSDTPTRVRGIRSGADDFLVKPFDPDELLARIESLIARNTRGSALLSGQFESQSLIELLQMLSHGEKTGAIHILAKETTGNILLDKGTLVNAAFGERRSLAAMETMLQLDRGLFQFNASETIPDSSKLIREPLDRVIMNLMWFLDEVNKRKDMRFHDDLPLRIHGHLETSEDDLEGIPVRFVYGQIQTRPGITPAQIFEMPQYSNLRLELALCILKAKGSIRPLKDHSVTS